MARATSRASLLIPSLLAIVVAGGTAWLASQVMPTFTQPIRNNLIGPERYAVDVPLRDGGTIEGELTLVALAQTRSVFAVESPYLQRTTAEVRLTKPDALPSEIDVAALNAFVTERMGQRLAGSWHMDQVVIPRFADRQRVARTATREWLWWGVLDNGWRLAIMGVLPGVVAFLGIRVYQHQRARRAGCGSVPAAA
ncbi:MAG: hypothetical protein ACYTGC_00870 [Planctomycetota bacterium]|jgi:hypothetical protein